MNAFPCVLKQSQLLFSIVLPARVNNPLVIVYVPALGD